VSQRQLSRAEYERVVRAPKRRYRALSIRDGGWRLRERVRTPVLWFERDDVGEEAGIYWRRPYIPVVTLMVDGWPAVLFYFKGRRLDSCTFAYNLTVERLAVAVSAMRKAGLARYIRPAAEWALKEVPAYNRAVLEPALRTLLTKLRTRSRRS
jgi:hypothetical protein